MIYPGRRAIYLVAGAAPVALVAGVLVPGGWLAILAWIALIVILTLVDALLTPRPPRTLDLAAPPSIWVGDTVILRPDGSMQADAHGLHYAADIGPPLAEVPGSPLHYAATRRGQAALRRIWARRRGPLGLAWRQVTRTSDRVIRILPNLRPVREQGMRQYLRSTRFGARMRAESGDGSEFQALTDFQPGMERRAIDWKASARHASLLAREYRTERDNAIVLAVDAGRAMADPLQGVPRVDHAVSAALLAAFVALKAGDCTRLFSFAAQPGIDSGTVAHARGFAEIHRSAAAIDYGAQESNYTLCLSALDAKLRRRSIILLFTEFTDPTSAELMLAAARRVARRHRLIFVIFDDVELEAIRDARPRAADDVVRANAAHELLRERRIVVERLKRLGIDVIQARPDAMPLTLVDRYLSLRERA
ncbi:DUF58 domain-containing protein [Stakelama saccharophila]|uniref:DUF58 domain-containing protein n=1 Tax=Stakelama saccharophila TaxID=3075605 RepID=A0ABZ0BDG4_9SPHN|nr:DUF58 domain-containing protein [Stakelama sp. W311]WNO54776.1 DUF58 domain-containing protein [Stakelama sp. W311]